MNCAVCDAQLPAPTRVGRPRRYCSAACRRRAYHARHQVERVVPAPRASYLERSAAQVPEPLLAAIVFVPVGGVDTVLAAQPFGGFPWQEFLAELRDGRAEYPPAGTSVSSRCTEFKPRRQCGESARRKSDESDEFRGEIHP